jgi:hypothetical protein
MRCRRTESFEELFLLRLLHLECLLLLPYLRISRGFLLSVRSLDHGYRGQITCMYSCSHEDSLPYHSNIVMSQSSKIPPNILIDSCTPFWSLSRHHKECAVVRTTLPPLILNERGWRSLRRKQSCQGHVHGYRDALYRQTRAVLRALTCNDTSVLAVDALLRVTLHSDSCAGLYHVVFDL